MTRRTVLGHVFEIRPSHVKGHVCVYIWPSRDAIGLGVLSVPGRKGPWIRRSEGLAMATADRMAREMYGGWRDGEWK